jgi:hypothetical protein
MMSKYKTRYFNTIEESETSGVLVKKSSDVEKLREEYNYWYSLPKNLQPYFVKPFKFKIENGLASYCMEEVEADNVGSQLAAGALSEQEFRSVFSKILDFKAVANLAPKDTSKLNVDLNAKFLVLDKTKSRIQDLEKSYWVRSHYALSLNNAGISLDSLYSLLVDLFNKQYVYRSTKSVVVSHGDLTLSNMLWNADTDVFKLIDPRGSSYMYMDEYYDLAKLSQSINGRYEDIIHGEYTLDVSRGKLSFARQQDSSQQDIFNEYLDKRGIDVKLVRIYEASLFLSMLPMHLDDPQRIAAFLLNCNSILNNL